MSRDTKKVEELTASVILRLSVLPMIGEKFEEWFEAFLARKVGWSKESFLCFFLRQKVRELVNPRRISMNKNEE